MKRLINLILSNKVTALALAHKKISLGLLILIIALSFIFIPKNQNLPLTEKVSIGNVEKTVSVTGDVDAENSVNLTFQTPETLAWVGAKEGDTVYAGQAIASLNQDKLQATLRQAEADFTAAKAASDKYYDGHTTSSESYDEKITRTTLDDAVIKAYDQIVKVQYDIAHSTLYTPIAGILTRADAKFAGVNVGPTTVFTVTDPTSLNFKIEVDEADIGAIDIGQLVNVYFDSNPDSAVKLSIDKIDFVSHKTASGGNAFWVKAQIPNPGLYRVGMSGNADIVVNSREKVLSVSPTSVVDNKFVYLRIGNKFKKTVVRTGLEGDTSIQIISGLRKDDEIALDPESIPQSLIIK